MKMNSKCFILKMKKKMNDNEILKMNIVKMIMILKENIDEEK